MTIKKQLGLVFCILFFISIVCIPPSSLIEIHDTPEIILQPRTSALDERQAFAIVVGIEDYPDPWSDLSYTIDDANEISSQLYNNYGIDDMPIGIQYLQVLLDSDASKAGIESAFSHVANFINSYDIFFFYFSGHGLPSSIPSLAYLCPWDASTERIYSTDLDSYLDSVNCSEQYIIIDACGSGGLMDDASAPNRYFMTACERNEESIETSGLQNGVFTYYFLQSFTQATDSNGDGVISMEEQFDYTYPRTVSYSTGRGAVHHPVEDDGIIGETVIDTAIGELTFIPNGRELNYSFYLYGHGTITLLNITVCCVAGSITIETFDIIPDAPSNTGFGFYSGNITVSCSDDITGYEITVIVNWPKNPPGDPKTIEYSFGDTDGDNLPDLLEIENGLNPSINDTDDDGLDDYLEYYGITNPILNDTDLDGMLDGYEVYNGLDPLTNDTMLDLDFDGLINILEYTLGTIANDSDTDSDTMNDGYEYVYGLDLFSDDAGLDLDFDGLLNGIECQCGSMANNSDSDNDTMPDKWEYDNTLDLLSNDTLEDPDNDGLNNIGEYHNGTDPNNEDTDGDGYSDGDEVLAGTDPLDPNDHPVSTNNDPTNPSQGISLGFYFIPFFLPAVILSIAIYKKKTKFT
jgi:hypothetical protein